MAIGKRLDALLQARGVKPGSLATLTGINKNTIYAIIKRDSEKVNMVALHKIADALHVSIDYFFDETIDMYLPAQDEENPAPESSNSERDEVYTLFTSLSEENQKRLLDFARVLLKAQQAEHGSQT